MKDYKPNPTRFGAEYENDSVEVSCGYVKPYIAGDAGSKSLSVKEARQLISNLIAACDAAERLQQEAEDTDS